jgi:hypothetical protein
MVGNVPNPYWGQAKQYQQQKQPQHRPQFSQDQGEKQRRERRARDDFGDEWRDRNVEIECIKGQVVDTIRGRVDDVSKYWLKLFVNNQVLYLNKAFILSIKPAEIGGGASGGVNGDGKQRPG